MSGLILPNRSPKRVAFFTTTNTGGSMDMNGPEGQVQLRRADPHGVIMMFGDRQFSIQKHFTPILGRYFLAAGVLLGQDINEGWDTPEGGQVAVS